ncbi:Lrp/AsnC family transcriptional regulator [Vibrio europaeus]|uniref:ArsR family transcriptional regulator n=1 Tax=Vibrio europaeus TaxID=300876 RepID=A0A178J6W4_9VIBR|nr:Lrp/AsnC family transcriptional regulator [Vibrio europaeus]MDC5706086.1 Lrp/AsnC family transcriptional regulator [Vibrio europaeus]MDC5709496.1 Lrp/AsnC family transcriptional regulator [Vibrio europaeus]MDC5713895.1 Lrp/AsnC family transcriptional regulator [Vibrio europaeus]MDC5720662.1 Lrp/AsnC family transcriptional regulator [Vibrio europaeus]MDC5723496.1 Lrp/AsnC family transcriptional regulator [Vibrio europaeus]
MDKFDRQIIDILKLNARESVSDIARKVNLSRTAVTARIQKLEHEKVILGYHADVAKTESKELIKAYLALKFDMSSSTQYCETYAELIYQIDGVKWCHAISGETDMMLYVEVDSMTRLNAIRDELQKIPELRHLMTHTVLNEFFNTLGQQTSNT